MKRAIIILVSAVAVLAAAVGIRTATFVEESAAVPATPPASIRPGAAERLAGSLRFATISRPDPAEVDVNAFADLHRYLERAFPLAHARLRRETVGTHSKLFTWAGSDTTLPPILLLGHQDVVSVEPGTEAQWLQPPFAGRVSDGFIWGRGAIDNKSTVLGTLEAVEMLLAEGFTPKRTVYLAFGHDEEVGGGRGAREVAALLKSRNVRLAMVLDEGGVIGDGILQGVAEPTALVGIAEKGFASVELSVTGSGGHSSLPPRESAIGILSAAVARLEARQMPARLEAGGATRQLFERVGPRFPFAQRAAFANLWIARPMVLRTLEGSPSTNALIRTTTAVTIFQAGTKDNVLASSARAVVNFRILQGDSIAGVLNHVRRAVDDERVEVRLAGAFSAEPSGVSETANETFRTLERSIREVNPAVVVAPFLVVVVTDARHFADISDDAYRFLPLRLAPADLARMHGTNERIAVSDYEQGIRLYRQVIVNSAGR